MHRKRRARIAALMTLFVFLIAATAQPKPPEQAKPVAAGARPRLGLVLSGGGARGAAHIGVIQVLEELRVPVDLVTGTSMGSVVGGLYAAGLSPDELSDVIQSTDWVNIFDDKPDRQELSFRRKQDDKNFLTNLRLGFKDWHLFIPSGLVEGQKLDFLLRSLTLSSTGLAQIEDLPVPFRAVATDIVTGEAVVFDSGELAVAQRASMSVPAAFSPIIKQPSGRVLVDGFVANNLPIDIAQQLGAEHVIAVDISTPASKLDELTSAVAIQGQVGTFPVQEQQRRQIERLKPDDVLLQPDLGDISSAAFPRMAEAIEIGRQTALANRDALARYAVSEEEYAEWRAHQRRSPPQMPVIGAIQIENKSLLADSVIRAHIHAKLGEPLDLQQLSDDLGRLYGLDAFERVRFDLRPEPEGMVLVYEVDARERGTHYLRVGLNLEADIGHEAIFNFALNHVWFPIDPWNGEIRTDVQVGDTTQFTGELYQPVTPRDLFFVEPFVQYEKSDVDIFPDPRHRVASYYIEQTETGILGGVNFWNIAQLRGGIGYLDIEASLKTGDPATFPSDSTSGGVYAAIFEADTLDNVHFPNEGVYAKVEALWPRKELGFDQSFTRFSSSAALYQTFYKNTVGVKFRYDTSYGGHGVGDLRTLGGFTNLSGFQRNSIVGEQLGLLGLEVYRRIATPAVFAWKFPVYVGLLGEYGNATEERSDILDEGHYSISPFVGVETPLGPLYIAYAYGEGGYNQGYLYLGRNF